MQPFAVALVVFPLTLALAIGYLLHVRPQATLTEAADALAAVMRALFRRGP